MQPNSRPRCQLKVWTAYARWWPRLPKASALFSEVYGLVRSALATSAIGGAVAAAIVELDELGKLPGVKLVGSAVRGSERESERVAYGE